MLAGPARRIRSGVTGPRRQPPRRGSRPGSPAPLQPRRLGRQQCLYFRPLPHGHGSLREVGAPTLSLVALGELELAHDRGRGPCRCARGGHPLEVGLDVPEEAAVARAEVVETRLAVRGERRSGPSGSPRCRRRAPGTPGSTPGRPVSLRVRRRPAASAPSTSAADPVGDARRRGGGPGRRSGRTSRRPRRARRRGPARRSRRRCRGWRAARSTTRRPSRKFCTADPADVVADPLVEDRAEELPHRLRGHRPLRDAPRRRPARRPAGTAASGRPR